MLGCSKGGTPWHTHYVYDNVRIHLFLREHVGGAESGTRS